MRVATSVQRSNSLLLYFIPVLSSCLVDYISVVAAVLHGEMSMKCAIKSAFRSRYKKFSLPMHKHMHYVSIYLHPC